MTSISESPLRRSTDSLPRRESENATLLTVGLMASCINEKYINQLNAVSKTWAAKIPNGIKLYYLAGNTPCVLPEIKPNYLNLPAVGEDYNSAFSKQFLGLKTLVRLSPSKFYFIGGTDNYVVWNRLISLLESLNPNNEIYLGDGGFTTVLGKQLYFISGGGGIILSHATASRLADAAVEILEQWPVIAALSLNERNENFLLPACDVAIAYYLKQWGIEPIINPYFYRFNHLGLNDARKNGAAEVGINIDLEKMITCHYMTPEDMHTFNILIEKLQTNKGTTYISHFSATEDNAETKQNLVVICNALEYPQAWKQHRESNAYFLISSKVKVNGKTTIYPRFEEIDKYLSIIEVIKLNPFNSSHFLYGDSCALAQELIPKFQLRNEVNLYCTGITQDGARINLSLIGGRFDYLQTFCEEMIKLKSDLPAWDLPVVQALIKQKPSDYKFIYPEPITALADIIKPARYLGQYDLCIDAAEITLSNAVCEENLELSILNEYFVAAWWKRDFKKCESIMNQMISLPCNPSEEIIRNTDYLHLVIPKARIVLEEEPKDVDLEKYHYFICGNYPITNKSYFLCNPSYRPSNLKI
jgi:hypothetical protein